MYAIIVDGGRQYRVQEGQELDLDYRDVPHGEQIRFERVLAVSGGDGLQLGQPTLQDVSVLGQVVGPQLGQKLVIQKFRRRKNSRRKTGHRQLYTRVRIQKIQTGAEPQPVPQPDQAEQPSAPADEH